MPLRFKSMVMVVLLASSVVGRGDDLNLSTPKEALHAFMVAQTVGDAATLKACTFNASADNLEAYCKGLQSMRDFDDAVISKFPDSGFKPELKTIEELTTQANTDYQVVSSNPINISGDTAELRGPHDFHVEFKNFDGRWKVDARIMIKYGPPEKERYETAVFKVSIDVRERAKQAILNGKYSSWPQAQLAVKRQMSDALKASAEVREANDALAKVSHPQAAVPPNNRANDPHETRGIESGSSAGYHLSREETDDEPIATLRTTIIGAKGGGGDTEHFDPDGSPGYGFAYTFGNWNNRQCISTLDPVFTASSLGGPAPQQRRRQQSQIIRARAGYVVGGLLLDFDDSDIVAVKVKFVGYKNGQLDPHDNYTSDWIGIPCGIHQHQLDGDSAMVIGTYDHRGLNEAAIGRLLASNVKKIKKMGGRGGGYYAVIGPEGSPVIGFNYAEGDWGGRKVVRFFDPIFRDSGSTERTNDAPSGDLTATRARDGYVVSGLLVDADDVNVLAVKIHFVRLKDGTVDARDTYDSDWIGLPGEIRQKDLHGDAGEVVIGTYGHQGLNLASIGLLVAPVYRSTSSDHTDRASQSH